MPDVTSIYYIMPARSAFIRLNAKTIILLSSNFYYSIYIYFNYFYLHFKSIKNLNVPSARVIKNSGGPKMARSVMFVFLSNFWSLIANLIFLWKVENLQFCQFGGCWGRKSLFRFFRNFENFLNFLFHI